MGKINIYTDGAASGNPGPGGYGIVLEYNGKIKELSDQQIKIKFELDNILSSLPKTEIGRFFKHSPSWKGKFEPMCRIVPHVFRLNDANDFTFGHKQNINRLNISRRSPSNRRFRDND